MLQDQYHMAFKSTSFSGYTFRIEISLLNSKEEIGVILARHRMNIPPDYKQISLSTEGLYEKQILAKIMIQEMELHGGHNLSQYNWNELVGFSSKAYGDIAEFKIELLKSRLTQKNLYMIQEKCKSKMKKYNDISIIELPE